ncbi:MAG: hypothetical protein ACREX3_23390 [Gammaproteobacteria bacterium]
MTATAMEFPSEYTEPIPLAGLSGIWLRFHLLAITPLQLSAYKGSTFHGAFGWVPAGAGSSLSAWSGWFLAGRRIYCWSTVHQR